MAKKKREKNRKIEKIEPSPKKLSPLAIVLPGLLVAATGVGAGDLATGALVGSRLGMTVLWVVLLGAGMKFLLNEGLARWQLATGTTLLEGCVSRLGRTVGWLFLGYLLVWSLFVASALMNACGAVAHAIRPCYVDLADDKIFYGLIHSAAAVVLILRGGFRTFERMMAFFIAVMFVIVVMTAVTAMPSWGEFLKGIVWPIPPDFSGERIALTLALMGGVGGTVTILCYGYWIRENGRRGLDDLKTCRIDLAVAYALTAVFGLAVVVIGSQVDLADVTKANAGLFDQLGLELERQFGAGVRWTFLFGAWAAIFSSMLGVWQSVPYLFADVYRLLYPAESRKKITERPAKPHSLQEWVDYTCGAITPLGAYILSLLLFSAKSRCKMAKHSVSTRSLPYRTYLLGLATIPAAGLWMPFAKAQILYAIVGAMFIPMLAAVLLTLNGKSSPLADEYRNSRRTTVLLIGVLVFFVAFGCLKLLETFS